MHFVVVTTSTYVGRSTVSCAAQNNIDAGKGVLNVEWSTDSAFGVYPDFKSHVGGTMMFEKAQ